MCGSIFPPGEKTVDLVNEAGIGNSKAQVDNSRSSGSPRCWPYKGDAPLIKECYANFDHLGDCRLSHEYGLFSSGNGESPRRRCSRKYLGTALPGEGVSGSPDVSITLLTI